MKILMLGWEFPPHISGGLGTACEGLTLGLARQSQDVTFVVPHLYGGEQAFHMNLVNSQGKRLANVQEYAGQTEELELIHGSRRITKKLIPSLLQPYFSPETFEDYLQALQLTSSGEFASVIRGIGVANEVENFIQKSVESAQTQPDKPVERYGRDIFSEVGNFATQVAASLRDLDFDIIHCHDWMTFPAAIALSRLSGKPVVAHVHSLELDRSGSTPNQTIFEIERWGLEQANAIIAVSYYTKDLISSRLGVKEDKISVVHNGVYSEKEIARYKGVRKDSKIILFLGRITFQKGPDYFVQAAAKVIPHIPEAIFVMAGAGDMLPRMVERVRQLGLEKNFQFPGFLRGDEVEEMFSVADLYVMPSVSEPFGISALEAIKFDTPVIISRQSGVSEVLRHALKVDFWDVDRMADLMINALMYPELRDDLSNMAAEEIKRLHWDSAAVNTIDVYKNVLS